MTVSACLLDLFLNTNLSNAVYLSGTFDIRATCNILHIRFIANGLSFSTIPLYVISKKYFSLFYSRLSLCSIIASLVIDLLAPGKGIILEIPYQLMNFIYWKMLLNLLLSGSVDITLQWRN